MHRLPTRMPLALERAWFAVHAPSAGDSDKVAVPRAPGPLALKHSRV
jgi:hypothetical protein